MSDVAQLQGSRIQRNTKFVTQVACYSYDSYKVANVAFIIITSYLITSCAGTVATGERSEPAATRSKARFP